jgi:hypothetical protein
MLFPEPVFDLALSQRSGVGQGSAPCDDIFLQDSRNLILDAEEVIPKFSVLDPYMLFGSSTDTSWHRKPVFVLDDHPHVMEGVEGLLDTVRRLLDVGKLDYVLEHVSAILDIFRPLPELAFLPGLSLESIIYNTHDVGIVFCLCLTPRV